MQGFDPNNKNDKKRVIGVILGMIGRAAARRNERAEMFRAGAYAARVPGLAELPPPLERAVDNWLARGAVAEPGDPVEVLDACARAFPEVAQVPVPPEVSDFEEAEDKSAARLAATEQGMIAVEREFIEGLGWHRDKRHAVPRDRDGDENRLELLRKYAVAIERRKDWPLRVIRTVRAFLADAIADEETYLRGGRKSG